MRCSCPRCGTYMIQAESMRLGCVCPDCGCHCSDCLGTDTVISRDAFRALKEDPSFEARYAQDMTPSDPEDGETGYRDDPEDKRRGE